MRIRKHAKISPLNPAPNPSPAAAPTAAPEICVCQLNQSPWDVMTFPPEDDNDDPATLPPSPPPFLVDGDYFRRSCYITNRTSASHITAGKSTPPPKKKSRGDVIAVAPPTPKPAVVVRVNNHRDREENSKSMIEEEEEEEIVLCGKTDKNGWQCGQRVKKGHSFCEKHLPKGKTNNKKKKKKNPAPAAAPSKKSDEKIRRRESAATARPRKPTPASNPYEFYYYSGFGPRWGKRRRSGTTGESNSGDVKQEAYSSLESGSGSDTSNASRNVSVITEDAGGPPKSQSNRNGSDNKGSVFTQFKNGGLVDYSDDLDDEMEEDFDFVDDEESEDDDDGGKIGKKRARSRKPIKARSLKSLM